MNFTLIAASDWLYHDLVAQVQRTSTFFDTYVVRRGILFDWGTLGISRPSLHLRFYEMHRLVLTTSGEGVFFRPASDPSMAVSARRLGILF